MPLETLDWRCFAPRLFKAASALSFFGYRPRFRGILTFEYNQVETSVAQCDDARKQIMHVAPGLSSEHASIT